MIGTYKNWFRLLLYRMDIMPQVMILKTRDGSQFHIRERKDQTADAYVVNESYLYGIHNEMIPYMRNAKVGIDLGAHIGTFAVWAGKRSTAKIYAIEPDDDNLELLEKNIAMNHMTEKIIPVKSLITSTTGKRDLYVFKNRGLNSIYKEHGMGYGQELVEKRSIRSMTLEDFFREKNIKLCDFLKVDVESAEHDIFMNLPEDIYKRIRVMGIEIANDKEKLAKHIQEMGFKVVRPRQEFSEYFCVNTRFS